MVSTSAMLIGSPLTTAAGLAAVAGAWAGNLLARNASAAMLATIPSLMILPVIRTSSFAGFVAKQPQLAGAL